MTEFTRTGEPRRPSTTWFKTRRTPPFVVPVEIFKANAKWIYPDNPVGSQSVRRLRHGTEHSYFKTEDEAWGFVRSQQGKTDGRETGKQPAGH